jgi:hypothetical protein
VTQGLTVEELAELKRLEEQYGEMESFELTAAAISLASINTHEEMMPANLRARVLEDAQKFFDTSSVTTFPKQNEEQPSAQVLSFPERRRRSNNFIQWSGWLAAACVLLAFVLWASRPAEQPIKPRELTNAEKRDQLIAQAKDLVKSSWQGTKLPQAESVVGDVIWSKSEQKGYMRFRNLPVNDKTKETYQLWIFDKNQDEKYPVDGGVFDVNRSRRSLPSQLKSPAA